MAQDPVDDVDGQLRSRLQAALGSDYGVGSIVGRGASSRVWDAYDIPLDRKLAIKVLLNAGRHRADPRRAVEAETESRKS